MRDPALEVLEEGIWPQANSCEFQSFTGTDGEGVLICNWHTKASGEPALIGVHQTYEDDLIKTIELFFDATPFQGPPAGA